MYWATPSTELQKTLLLLLLPKRMLLCSHYNRRHIYTSEVESYRCVRVTRIDTRIQSNVFLSCLICIWNTVYDSVIRVNINNSQSVYVCFCICVCECVCVCSCASHLKTLTLNAIYSRYYNKEKRRSKNTTNNSNNNKPNISDFGYILDYF